MSDLVVTLSEALAWTLLNSLWQGALIAALLWISLRLLGAGSAARYTAGGTRTGWCAEVVPAGYVERRLSFQLEDPAGQVLHQHLARDEAGQLRPHDLFGTVDDLPAGRYRLALSWLGRTVEAHVEVDRAELLPLVSGVRFEEDLVLAWDAVPGAQRYRVDVRTPTGTRVYWLTEPTDTPVLTLEGLLPGAHSIENVWAYSQPAGCDGCQLNASVARVDLVFDVP